MLTLERKKTNYLLSTWSKPTKSYLSPLVLHFGIMHLRPDVSSKNSPAKAQIRQNSAGLPWVLTFMYRSLYEVVQTDTCSFAAHKTLRSFHILK